jgi:hypothetical protein
MFKKFIEILEFEVIQSPWYSHHAMLPPIEGFWREAYKSGSICNLIIRGFISKLSICIRD